MMQIHFHSVSFGLRWSYQCFIMIGSGWFSSRKPPCECAPCPLQLRHHQTATGLSLCWSVSMSVSRWSCLEWCHHTARYAQNFPNSNVIEEVKHLAMCKGKTGISGTTGKGCVSSSKARRQLEHCSPLQALSHLALAGLGFCFEHRINVEQLVHKVKHFSEHRKLPSICRLDRRQSLANNQSRPVTWQ